MAMLPQEQQPDRPLGYIHKFRHIPWKRLVIVLLMIVIVIVIGAMNIQASMILAILGIVVALFQWLFPISSQPSKTSTSSIPVFFRSSPPHSGIPMSIIGQSASLNLEMAQQSDRIATNEEPLKVDMMQIRPEAIFLFNVPLANPQEFYGRKRERMTLVGRTRIGASTSIVGPRKIGKTWLMSYLKLVAPQEFDTRFRIGYLDATTASCATVSEFVARATEELGASPSIANHTPAGMATLERVIKDLRSRNRVPVLCIDEFERFGNRESFDLNFFASLRAMTQIGLSLVVASKNPLIDIIGDLGNTSGFFNVFEQLTIIPFSAKDAEVFIQAKGIQAGFTDEEREHLLQYGQEAGQYWPLRLQLVGKLLLEDKVLAAKEKDHGYYLPSDPCYWQEFEGRLKEKYRGVGVMKT